MKRLSIQHSGHTISDKKIKQEWMLHQYPKLEHLDLIDDSAGKIELITLLERNPNIRRLSTLPSYLWENRDALLKSTAQLDTLEIIIYDFVSQFAPNLVGNEKAEPYWGLIECLRENGFFKRLHVYKVCNTENQVTELMSIECIDWLYVKQGNSLRNCWAEYSLTRNSIPDQKITLANKMFFVNIEHLQLNTLSTDEILPFIRHLPKLNKLKLIPKRFGEKQNPLQLITLNNAREQLTGACKVTIYVPDAFFVATKWANNGDIKLSLIEMKQSDTYDWRIFAM